MNPRILLKYENKWVALNSSRTRVLAAAKNLKTLDDKVCRIIKQKVIYHFVLPRTGYYSPNGTNRF